MNRRNFGKHLAAAAAVLAWPNAVHAANRAPRDGNLPLIKPRRLREGDLVGMVAPAGAMADGSLQRYVTNLEKLGFRVKVGKHIRAVHGGYAGTVAERLHDLHEMFEDREVKAVWAARGGSGCNGLLPGLRYDLIRRNPKILIGYSDITALHLAILRRAGLVTFHGPVAGSSQTDYTVTQMQAALMQPRREIEINMSIENERKARGEAGPVQPEFAQRILRPGVAEGRLVGGNLSVLAALVGTPYGAQMRDRLVFLEDVREAPYRIDRMLTQLQQATGNPGEMHGLARAAGVMLGVFTRAEVPADERSLTLDEVFQDQFGDFRTPVVSGYSFGHIPHQFTIPLGVRARLDTAAGTLTLLEPAVTD